MVLKFSFLFSFSLSVSWMPLCNASPTLRVLETTVWLKPTCRTCVPVKRQSWRMVGALFPMLILCANLIFNVSHTSMGWFEKKITVRQPQNQILQLFKKCYVAKAVQVLSCLVCQENYQSSSVKHFAIFSRDMLLKIVFFVI